MRTLLDSHPCFKSTREIALGITQSHDEPTEQNKLPILLLDVIPCQRLEKRASLSFLIDTGAEISGISPEGRQRLFEAVGQTLDPHRGVKMFFDDGRARVIESYDVRLVFPGGEILKCPVGLGCFPHPIFDFTDGVIGEDILNRLLVTFNGPDGTVTIIDPLS